MVQLAKDGGLGAGCACPHGSSPTQLRARGQPARPEWMQVVSLQIEEGAGNARRAMHPQPLNISFRNAAAVLRLASSWRSTTSTKRSASSPVPAALASLRKYCASAA